MCCKKIHKLKPNAIVMISIEFMSETLLQIVLITSQMNNVAINGKWMTMALVYQYVLTYWPKVNIELKYLGLLAFGHCLIKVKVL